MSKITVLVTKAMFFQFELVSFMVRLACCFRLVLQTSNSYFNYQLLLRISVWHGGSAKNSESNMVTQLTSVWVYGSREIFGVKMKRSEEIYALKDVFIFTPVSDKVKSRKYNIHSKVLESGSQKRWLLFFVTRWQVPSGVHVNTFTCFNQLSEMNSTRLYSCAVKGTILSSMCFVHCSNYIP